MDRLLTLREVAERTGLPRFRVWSAARAGDLATTRFSKRGVHYVREADVATWLARHRHAPLPKLTVPRATAPEVDALAAHMPRTRRFA